MLRRQYILEPTPHYPLHVTAKQYWLPEFEAHWDDPDALTLIVLHSTSFHKETWKPTIQHMFDSLLLRSRVIEHGHAGGNIARVKCAWAIECPNHGESAALNEAALQQAPYFRKFGCEKYAEAVHRFMVSGPDLSPPVDFMTQKLIGIGHSLGGVAITILQGIKPLFPFEALILVEPLLSPHGPEHLHPLKERLMKSARERCHTWPSRADALKYLASKRHIARWDPRVLDLYVRYGLRSCSTQLGVAHPDAVTLSCSREEEVTMYQDPTGPERGLVLLNEISGSIPVDVIFGDENDLIPRTVQDALVDRSSGRRFHSVHRIDGAGHLVPQQVPEKLSQVIVDVLASTPTQLTSKL